MQNPNDESHRFVIHVEYSTNDRFWQFGFSIRKAFDEWVRVIAEAANTLKH